MGKKGQIQNCSDTIITNIKMYILPTDKTRKLTGKIKTVIFIVICID